MRVKGSSPAVRVAAVATAAIAVVYVIGAVVLNIVVASHLTQMNDEHLGNRLTFARHSDTLRQPVGRADPDADGDPVFLWAVSSRHVVVAHSPGAPALPPALLTAGSLHDGRAVTADLGGAVPYRLKVARDQQGWLVAGQNVLDDQHTEGLVLDIEIIAGPFLLLAMFLGLLVVGTRALAPVEQSRRRQLEFTADASHELRTPLSVIRAEADVALSAPREAAQYRDSLRRIQGESQRLRQLVEDMLWLARFDSKPPPPGSEPVDLATLAQALRRTEFRAGRPRGQRGDPGRRRADQRAARLGRPAGRGARRQRLPVRGPGRHGPDRGQRPGQPGRPDRGGQRPGIPGRPNVPACSTASTGPPSDGSGAGLRPGHRGLGGSLDRRPVGSRRLAPGRGAPHGRPGGAPRTLAGAAAGRCLEGAHVGLVASTRRRPAG